MHISTSGISALTEAESRFDGDICRLLIKEAGADPSQLDRVQYSRSGMRTPRSATPEVLPTSPRLSSRKKHRSRSTEQLSPLVGVHSRMSRSPDSCPGDLTPRFLGENMSKWDTRWDPNMYLKKAHSFDSMSTATDCESECSLPDVQEDVEEEEAEAEAGKNSRGRRNSLSLPDLRDVSNTLSISPRLSPRSSGDERYPKHILRYERSHTLEERTSPLPQLSEEDEDVPLSPPVAKLNKRRGSVSLPDLRDCTNCLVGMTNNGMSDSGDDDNEDTIDDIPDSHRHKENHGPHLNRPKQRNTTKFPPLLSTKAIDEDEWTGQITIVTRDENNSKKVYRTRGKQSKISVSLQVGAGQQPSPRPAHAVSSKHNS